VCQPRARFLRVDPLSAIERGEPPAQFAIQFRKLGDPIPVVFFQEPQSLSNDFAGGIVPTRSNF
jgi:hypothetical protein